MYNCSALKINNGDYGEKSLIYINADCIERKFKKKIKSFMEIWNKIR